MKGENVVYRNPNKARVFFRAKQYTLPEARANLNKVLLKLGVDPQTIREGNHRKGSYEFLFNYPKGTTAFMEALHKIEGAKNEDR